MKPYVKPELFLEEFELSQSVAACGWHMTSANELDCVAIGNEEKFPENSSDVRLFSKATNVNCNVEFDESEYCYENGSMDEATKLLAS